MAAIHLKDVSMYYAILLQLASDDTICPKKHNFKSKFLRLNPKVNAKTYFLSKIQNKMPIPIK